LQLALGNPLALVELPAAWRSAGTAMAQLIPQLVPLSGRLERAFAARLAELPSLTRDCLLVGAVDAEDDLPEILAATAAFCGCQIDAAILEPAVQAGLLTFDNARLRFRHPLVKSGILQAESTSRRQAASAALAHVLLPHPFRRAWYRAQATIGPDDEVADELASTHFESLRRGSVTAAITALERSAQLTGDSAQRGHRLLMAAELAYGLGRADMVARLLRAAGSNAVSDLDRARMEWLRELPEETDFTRDRRVVQLCEIAARAMAASDVDLALNVLVAAAVRCFWGQPHSDVRDLVVEVAESLTSAEADPRYLAAIAVAQPLLQGRAVSRALSTVDYQSVLDPEALALWGMAAHAIGDQPRACDYLDRAENRCRLEGRLGLLTQVLSLRSAVSIDLGDWRAAAEAAEEGRRLGDETGQSVWGSGSLTVVSRLHALMGEPQALTRAMELEVSLRQRGNTCFLAGAVLCRAFALLHAGRNLEAFDALRRLFDPNDPSCHERERLSGVMYLAEAAVHSRRVPEARPIVEQLGHTALITPSPILHTHLLYARAVLADDHDAEHLYLSALEQDLVRWPLVKARIELAYGSWLRRHRRAKEARTPLRSAQESFDEMGAKRWRDHARSELRAAGERSPDHDGSRSSHAWQDSLTAQELQIARLAAEGLTNRDIAERLFMSHRTVSAHLYHVFPKLNITSRSQLAALLATTS
jgi:DNA-binding CsgD family transcriptional regulator